MAHAASIPIATLTPAIMSAIPLEESSCMTLQEITTVESHFARVYANGAISPAYTHSRSEILT